MDFKKYFQRPSWSKSDQNYYGLAGVVYKVEGGQVYVFLSTLRSSAWQLPYIFVEQQINLPEAQATLLTELSTVYSLNKVKIWQNLGQFSLEQKKKVVRLQVFLVQCEAGVPTGEAGGKMAWMSPPQALDNLKDSVLQQVVTLAVSKIKRASI